MTIRLNYHLDKVINGCRNVSDYDHMNYMHRRTWNILSHISAQIESIYKRKMKDLNRDFNIHELSKWKNLVNHPYYPYYL